MLDFDITHTSGNYMARDKALWASAQACAAQWKTIFESGDHDVGRSIAALDHLMSALGTAEQAVRLPACRATIKKRKQLD